MCLHIFGFHFIDCLSADSKVLIRQLLDRSHEKFPGHIHDFGRHFGQPLYEQFFLAIGQGSAFHCDVWHFAPPYVFLYGSATIDSLLSLLYYGSGLCPYLFSACAACSTFIWFPGKVFLSVDFRRQTVQPPGKGLIFPVCCSIIAQENFPGLFFHFESMVCWKA